MRSLGRRFAARLPDPSGPPDDELFATSRRRPPQLDMAAKHHREAHRKSGGPTKLAPKNRRGVICSDRVRCGILLSGMGSVQCAPDLN